jgi:hypothetical protein
MSVSQSIRQSLNLNAILLLQSYSSTSQKSFDIELNFSRLDLFLKGTFDLKLNKASRLVRNEMLNNK